MQTRQGAAEERPFRKLLTLVAAILVAALATLALAACGDDDENGNGDKTEITESGSTSVQPLAERMANAFTESHPGIDIVIQGGGSSAGVKAVDQGTVDIGAASRELKPDEPDLVKHLLARDGIAIVTHPDNEVSGLTIDEVRDIFAGDITNWSEVGGEDKEIHVVAREEGSGTRGAFEEMVMGEEGPPITGDAILQNSNGAVRTTVSGDPDSIGFLSFGYVTDDVKALDIDGVAATAETAKDGTYPIVRPLYFLTKEEPTGTVKEFVDFCLGAEGQDIAEEEGYIRVD
jgi:phosphate transport system substrate-binding protein